MNLKKEVSLHGLGLDIVIPQCLTLLVAAVPQELCWGIKETFAEFFACMECSSAYNGNPEDELVAVMGDNKYGPRGNPASIGLYRGQCAI